MSYGLLIAGLVTGSASTVALEPDAATDAALLWLSSVDRGAYAQSWWEAGEAFQAQITATAWASKLAAVRAPFGAVSSRHVFSRQTSTTLPGAPDGKYEIVRFATDFTDKPTAIETVVLSQEGAGWRVIGYYVS